MADASSREYLERRGIRALEPSVALAALQQALDADIAHTVVVDVDWAKFRVGFEAWGPRPLLLEMGSSGVVAAAGEGDGRLVRELEKLPQRERVAHVRAWLAEQCAVVLGHAEPSRLELQRGLFDLGMDSLMMVELRRRLSRALGSDVPPGVMFSHPSIMALAEHVASELLPSPAQPELTATQTDELESDELDSDEDVLRFINEKFERGG